MLEKYLGAESTQFTQTSVKFSKPRGDGRSYDCNAELAYHRQQNMTMALVEVRRSTSSTPFKLRRDFYFYEFSGNLILPSPERDAKLLKVIDMAHRIRLRDLQGSIDEVIAHIES